MAYKRRQAMLVPLVLLCACAGVNAGVAPQNGPPRNAYDDYRAAAKLIVAPPNAQGTIAPPPGSSPKLLGHYTPAEEERLVRANGPALRRLRQGLGHPFRAPHFSASDTDLAFHSHVRELARLLRIEGDVRSRHGDWPGAARSCLDAVFLGAQIQRGAPIIGMLVGVAVESIGRRGAWSTVTHLDAEGSKAAAQRLEQMIAHHPTFAGVAAEERNFILRSLSDALRARDNRGRLIRKRPVPEGFEEEAREDDAYFREGIARYGKQGLMARYRTRLQRIVDDVAKPFPLKDKSLYAPQKDLVGDELTIFYGTSLRASDNAGQNALLAASLALNAYHQERRSYPERLDELVPAYLKRVPKDPFTEHDSLRYRREGDSYLLYSIGPDGKDDGGRPIDNPPEEGSAPMERTRRFVLQESKGDIVAGVNTGT